jgi:hypothetical protein
MPVGLLLGRDVNGIGVRVSRQDRASGPARTPVFKFKESSEAIALHLSLQPMNVYVLDKTQG